MSNDKIEYRKRTIGFDSDSGGSFPTLKEWAYILISLLIIVVLVMTMKGLIDGTNLGCVTAIKRIEYLFPWYRFGCWLGSPL